MTLFLVVHRSGCAIRRYRHPVRETSGQSRVGGLGLVHKTPHFPMPFLPDVDPREVAQAGGDLVAAPRAPIDSRRFRHEGFRPSVPAQSAIACGQIGEQDAMRLEAKVGCTP